MGKSYLERARSVLEGKEFTTYFVAADPFVTTDDAGRPAGGYLWDMLDMLQDLGGFQVVPAEKLTRTRMTRAKPGA